MPVTLDEKSSGRGAPSRRKAPALGEETLEQSRNRLDAGRWSSAFEALRPEAAQCRAVQPGSRLEGQDVCRWDRELQAQAGARLQP